MKQGDMEGSVQGRKFFRKAKITLFLSIGLILFTSCGLSLSRVEQPTVISPIVPSATVTQDLSPIDAANDIPKPSFVETPEAPNALSGGEPSFLTPTLNAASIPEMPYKIQMGSPKYLPAFAHAEQGCQWMGIAGQVFDKGENGIPKLVVAVTGMLEGKPVNLIAFTQQQSVYGPGGYEIMITDHLTNSFQPLEVQLYTEQGDPLSDPVTFPVPASCDQNLALVNFQSDYSPLRIFLPLIRSSSE